jgi:hypothetical protein
MNDLDVIKAAYDKVGIHYVVRENGKNSYLFLCNEKTAIECATGDLDRLLRQKSFMEFGDGKVASY